MNHLTENCVNSILNKMLEIINKIEYLNSQCKQYKELF
jgi:hypothetical protein